MWEDRELTVLLVSLTWMARGAFVTILCLRRAVLGVKRWGMALKRVSLLGRYMRDLFGGG